MALPKGGLLIPKRFLLNLLQAANTGVQMVGNTAISPLGLVFYLDPNDRADVELIVKTVSWHTDTVANTQAIIVDADVTPPAGSPNSFMGLSNTTGLSTAATSLEFEFDDLMNRQGMWSGSVLAPFGFGFISYPQLRVFLSTVPDGGNVIVTGMHANFGSIFGLIGDYFTFKFEPHPSVVYNITDPLNPNNLGVPGFLIAVPCPPHWKENEGLGPNEFSQNQIFFKKLSYAVAKSESETGDNCEDPKKQEDSYTHTHQHSHNHQHDY